MSQAAVVFFRSNGRGAIEFVQAPACSIGFLINRAYNSIELIHEALMLERDSNVLAYRRKRKERVQAALGQMRDEADELGIYE